MIFFKERNSNAVIQPELMKSNQIITKQNLLACFLLMFAVATPFLAASIGAVSISPQHVFHALFASSAETHDISSRIIIELRMPRILLAFTAGAGLALAGCVLQLVTRNPLADPYLFGISSGASFGAVVVMTTMGTAFSSAITLPIGAFIGAVLSVLLVLSLSRGGLNSQVERMLLSGVATSFMFGALSSLLLYFSDPQAAASVLFWTLGSFSRASWNTLWLPIVIVFTSLLLLLGLKRTMVALQAGDETAHTLGINVVRLRLSILLLCSLITATLVANCGGIGFVGLMVPHTIRMLFPRQQSFLLTAVAGGVFMVWVDVFARILLDNQELPVGVITAAIGSAFFLFVLRQRRQECHERI